MRCTGFRHGLVQDSAYDSLLRQERRFLHRMIAHTVQEENADRLDQAASLLAYHYDAADDQAFEFAVPRVMRRHGCCPRQYRSRRPLLSCDSSGNGTGNAGARRDPACGKIYERSGNFNAALTDFEDAYEIAHTDKNLRAEWQSLIDIGVLWSQRDYEFTGTLYRRGTRACPNAGRSKIDRAESLNRVGNYYINIECPGEALDHHHRA